MLRWARFFKDTHREVIKNVWFAILIHLLNTIPLPVEMPVSNDPAKFLKLIKARLRRGLDFSSLQVRLTVGLTLATALGLGGAMISMTWQMRKMMKNQHHEQLEYVMENLPNALKSSDKIMQTQQLQPIVERFSSPDVWIWVKDTNGRILAQSSGFQAISIYANLRSLNQSITEPTVIAMQSKWVLLWTYSIAQASSSGRFYIAQDVTRDYDMLETLNQQLQMTMIASIALISLFIAWFIWQSLRPLHQVNQTAADTTNLQIDPTQFPAEVRELARTCNALIERLSETSLKQQQFTNSVSHELRTPLSLIYGYLQSTLRRCSNLTAAQQEALSIAALETENTIQLLQGLLETARTDSALLALHPEPVHLNPLLDDVIQMVQKFDDRTVQLEAEANVRAIADREALTRVLVYLLDNAVQYSPADQPITLRLYARPRQAVIQVCDRGCGLSRAQQSKIFEPLYRVDESRTRSTGGTGLGLSIAKSLTEAMGGAIAVESELNRGSTFTITLPQEM